jgi:hypothetical protein
MSAASDIVIDDGATTPVAHTFNPTRVKDDVVSFHDKDSGVILGYPQVTLGNRLPNKANGNYKATVKVRIPVLETAATSATGFTPGPTLAYFLAFSGEFIIPERATEAERDDLLAFAGNLIAHATVDNLVTQMDIPY